MTPLIFSIAATLRLYNSQANRGSLMSCLAPHCEYCILGNRRLTTIGLTGLSSLAPTPHRPFSHQAFIASRIHVRAPSFSVALAVAVAGAGNVAIRQVLGSWYLFLGGTDVAGSALPFSNRERDK